MNEHTTQSHELKAAENSPVHRGVSGLLVPDRLSLLHVVVGQTPTPGFIFYLPV